MVTKTTQTAKTLHQERQLTGLEKYGDFVTLTQHGLQPQCEWVLLQGMLPGGNRPLRFCSVSMTSILTIPFEVILWEALLNSLPICL